MSTEALADKSHFTESLRTIARDAKGGVLQIQEGAQSWRMFCLLGTIRAATALPLPSPDLLKPNAESFVEKFLTALAERRNFEHSFTETQETPSPESWLMELPLRRVLAQIARATKDLTALRDRWVRSDLRFVSAGVNTLEDHVGWLTPNEVFLLSRFEAPLTCADLLTISPFKEEETLRYFYALYLLSVIEPTGAPPRPAFSVPDAPKTASSESKASSGTRRKPWAPPAGATDWLTVKREIEERSYLLTHGSYYDLLGVTRKSSEEEIKAAYYALAKRFHPDRYQAEAPKEIHEKLVLLFGRLSEAYETLTDPARRKAYDQRAIGSPSAIAAANQPPQRAASRDQIAAESFDQGAQLFEQKEYAKALPYLREATRLKPSLTPYRFLFAKALAEIPQHRREAEEEFRKLLEAEPENADYPVAMGLFYKSVNLPSRAQKYFLRALELEPTNPRALQELGRAPTQKKSQPSFGAQVKKFFSKK